MIQLCPPCRESEQAALEERIAAMNAVYSFLGADIEHDSLKDSGDPAAVRRGHAWGRDDDRKYWAGNGGGM